MTDFDITAYLARVGLDAPVNADAEGLATLHTAQAYTIPFENFDVLLDRGIALAPDTLFDKLVRNRRGGYCFELNGLLLMALQAMGFEARPLLARVHLRGEPTPRTHQVNMVTMGNEAWIADVGFGGGGLHAPLKLETGLLTTQAGEQFRLAEAPPWGVMLQSRRLGEEDWQSLYSFDLTHVGPQDLEMGNFYASCHPTSFFTASRVAMLPNAQGRTALMDRGLRITRNGEEETRELPEGDAYMRALEDHFGIVMDVPYSALPPLRS